MNAPRLTPEEWTLLERLFTEAESVSDAERDDWIERNCPTARIREALEGLLKRKAGDTATGAFLAPGAAVAGDWLDRQADAGQPAEVAGFVLEREIGQGGSARVFLASRKTLGGRVAIKLLRLDAMASPETRRRFEFEHRLLAQLEHPHIARLLEAGVTADGIAFLAMEYVDGVPITEYCRGRPLRERLAVFRQVCDAVAHAHRRGIIHRDVKPGNILVDERGRAKLLDFGIGKLLEAEAGVAMPRTQTNFQLMTRQYAAPEQLLGKDVTTLTDVYALGVVLYELLTGERPFADAESSREALERKVTRSVPANPSSRARELPARELRGDLDVITLRALRLEPELRYPGASLLGADVQFWLDGLPIEARGGNRVYRARKFVTRHRWPAALATLVLAFGVFFLVREASLRKEAEAALATSEQVSEFMVSLFTDADPRNTAGQTLTVRDLVDNGVARIEGALLDQPAVRASVLQSLGAVYRTLGEYDESERLLKQALELSIATHGPTDIRTGRAMAELRYLYNISGGDHEAVDRLNGASLAIFEDEYGPDSVEVAGLKGDIAFGWVKVRRNTDQAVAYLEEALDVLQNAPDPDERYITSHMYHLGWARQHQGDLEGARALYLDVLERRRRMYGDTAPQLAWSLNNLGHLESWMGNPDQGEAYCREALAVNDRLYLGPHNEKAVNLRCISIAQTIRGEYDEALVTVDASIDMARKTLPETSHELAETVDRKARILAEMNALEPAYAALEEALRIFERSGDATAARQWEVMLAMSRIAHRRGDFERQLADAGRALARLESMQTGVDPAVFDVLHMQFQARLAMGQFEESAHILTALEHRVRALEPAAAGLEHRLALLRVEQALHSRADGVDCAQSQDAMTALMEGSGASKSARLQAKSIHGFCLALTGTDPTSGQALMADAFRALDDDRTLYAMGARDAEEHLRVASAPTSAIP